MLKTKLIFTCATFLLFLSCKKVAVPDPSVNQLFGEWKILSTSGGFTGGGDQSLLKKNTWIEIKKTGKFTLHQKNELPKSDVFKIVADNQTQGKYYLDFYKKRSGRSSDFTIKGDTLFLSDRYLDDGISSVYLRK